MLAARFQPKPLVDTIKEEEKYGNEGDVLGSVGRGLVSGTESLTQLLSSAVSVSQSLLGLAVIYPSDNVIGLDELVLHCPAAKRFFIRSSCHISYLFFYQNFKIKNKKRDNVLKSQFKKLCVHLATTSCPNWSAYNWKKLHVISQALRLRLVFLALEVVLRHVKIIRQCGIFCLWDCCWGWKHYCHDNLISLTNW